MTALVGDSNTDWIATLPHVSWLGDVVFQGPYPYPFVLDLVESASEAGIDGQCVPLIDAVLNAAAPRWAELDISPNPRFPEISDAPEEINDSDERLVLHSAARALTRLGSGYGCVLPMSSPRNRLADYFFERLVSMAAETDFKVVIPRAWKGSFSASDEISGTPLRKFEYQHFSARDRQALRVLSTAQSPVPEGIASDVGLSRSASVRLSSIRAGGAAYVVVEPDLRRALQNEWSTADHRRYACDLFDAWSPSGWGYIRRAHLAITARDRGRLLLQHEAIVEGCSHVARQVVYHHAVSLGSVVGSESLDQRVACHVTAARLSAWADGDDATALKLDHLTEARNLTEDKVQRVDLTYELANTHAKRRDAVSLSNAADLYAEGFRQLEEVDDDIQRQRLNIVLLNGFALVKYHSRADLEALELEEQAQELADDLDGNLLQLRSWAAGLVGVNTAKLLDRRFGNRCAAIDKLSSVLANAATDDALHSKIVRDIAWLNFADGNYTAVVENLSSLCPAHILGTSAPEDELRDRLILAVASLQIARHDVLRDQLLQLRVLCSLTGTPKATEMIELLTAVVDRQSIVSSH